MTCDVCQPHKKPPDSTHETRLYRRSHRPPCRILLPKRTCSEQACLHGSIQVICHCSDILNFYNY